MELEKQLREEAALQKLEEEKDLLVKQEEALVVKTEEVKIKKEDVEVKEQVIDKDLYDDELDGGKMEVKFEAKVEEEPVEDDKDESTADEPEAIKEAETKEEREKDVEPEEAIAPGKIDEEDYNEPIAYRRSARSVVKKAQEVQQLQKQFAIETKKITSPKKKPATPGSSKKPVKKAEVTYLEDYEEESEEEPSEEDSNSEDDIPLSSLSKKKKTPKKSNKKASAKRKSSKQEDETVEENAKVKKNLIMEEDNPDAPECVICLKSKSRTIVRYFK
jgi:hypothetical protein